MMLTPIKYHFRFLNDQFVCGHIQRSRPKFSDWKKKGGLKIHTKMPLDGFVPNLVRITEAACNDKTFLGQLESEKGAIYVFDKRYVNYGKWAEWTQKGTYVVTRLDENADYKVPFG